VVADLLRETERVTERRDPAEIDAILEKWKQVYAERTGR
jgi:hypothetical protein